MAGQYLAHSYCYKVPLPSYYENTGCNAPTSNDKQSEPASVSTNTVCDRWCGQWSTKEDALSSLFSQYRRETGKILRWYIDWEGYLEWFEVGERAGVEHFFDTDNRITTFNVTEDSSSIVNSITGTYGEGDDVGEVTLTNNTSITKYGLSSEDGLNNTCMDETEMTAYIQHQLDIKSVPIYNATMEMSGFYLIEPGKQMMFPDDPYYNDKIWTVVDWSFKDSGGTPNTTINLTTDESVISLPNEFEIIQSTAQKEVQKSLPEAAKVVSVVDNEHLLVQKESDKSKWIVRSLATSQDD